MKVKVLDERFVAHCVSEYSVTPQRTAVASSVHFDLLSANSFGGGGGGGSSGGGSDSNNGNEGNEGNEGTEGNEGNENDENNEGNEFGLNNRIILSWQVSVPGLSRKAPTGSLR